MGARHTKAQALPAELQHSSLGQLQAIIDGMIANNPWFLEDDSPPAERTQRTKEIMATKGFRAITPEEYRHRLAEASSGELRGRIVLWLPLPGFAAPPTRIPTALHIPTPTDSADGPDLDEGAWGADELPASREALTDELAARGLSEACSRLDTSLSDLDTEEWPTAGLQLHSH